MSEYVQCSTESVLMDGWKDKTLKSEMNRKLLFKKNRILILKLWMTSTGNISLYPDLINIFDLETGKLKPKSEIDDDLMKYMVDDNGKLAKNKILIYTSPQINVYKFMSSMNEAIKKCSNRSMLMKDDYRLFYELVQKVLQDSPTCFISGKNGECTGLNEVKHKFHCQDCAVQDMDQNVVQFPQTHQESFNDQNLKLEESISESNIDQLSPPKIAPNSEGPMRGNINRLSPPILKGIGRETPMRGNINRLSSPILKGIGRETPRSLSAPNSSPKSFDSKFFEPRSASPPNHPQIIKLYTSEGMTLKIKLSNPSEIEALKTKCQFFNICKIKVKNITFHEVTIKVANSSQIGDALNFVQSI